MVQICILAFKFHSLDFLSHMSKNCSRPGTLHLQYRYHVFVPIVIKFCKSLGSLYHRHRPATRIHRGGPLSSAMRGRPMRPNTGATMRASRSSTQSGREWSCPSWSGSGSSPQPSQNWVSFKFSNQHIFENWTKSTACFESYHPYISFTSRFIIDKFMSNLKILALLLMMRKITLEVKFDEKHVHGLIIQNLTEL